MVVRRWESLSGAVGLGIVFVALFLPGSPPKTDDTAAALTVNLVEHRTALVEGMLLAGLGLMALVWFYGVLGARLSPQGRRTSSFAITAAAGGLMGITLMFIGMLLFAGAAFRAASMGDEALVRSVVDTGNMLIETGKYGFAVLILATCAAPGAATFLTRRMKTVGVIAAAILMLSTVPPFLADHGIGQFGGGIDVVGGVPGFLWIIALSVMMARPADVACA
jgi:hypothetical protein